MYYGGLEVVSEVGFLYVRDQLGRERESREIETTRRGLQEALKKYVGDGIVVAVDAGGAIRWIHDELNRMGIEVHVVGPNRVKTIAESKKKTGKINARILSELLRIGALSERAL